MDDALFTVSPFLVPIIGILAIFAFATIRTLLRARVRELEIRERIVMIEKGLVPPPEVDPRGFDRARGRPPEPPRPRSCEHRRFWHG